MSGGNIIWRLKQQCLEDNIITDAEKLKETY